MNSKSLPLAWPVLKEEEVHVWQVSLDTPPIKFEDLVSVLSRDELQRAEQFVFPKDRYYFIVARGVLRHILSRYLRGISASELKFAYGGQGKPFLAPQENNALLLEFNLSHSKGMALYAVTLSGAIGVDVELVGEEVDGMAIAQRFFAPRESQELLSLPKNLQQRHFFYYWTLKEAVVKALGSGLFLSLDDFVVSYLPGEPAALLEIQGSIDKASAWTILPLELERGYLAGLAVLGKINLPPMYFFY